MVVITTNGGRTPKVASHHDCVSGKRDRTQFGRPVDFVDPFQQKFALGEIRPKRIFDAEQGRDARGCVHNRMALAQLELTQYRQFVSDKTASEWMRMSGAELFELLQYFAIGVDLEVARYLRNDPKFIYVLFQDLLNGTVHALHPVFTQYVSLEVTGQKFVRLEMPRQCWEQVMPTYDQWAALAETCPKVWFHRNVLNGDDLVRVWLDKPDVIRKVGSFGTQVMDCFDWLWKQLTVFQPAMQEHFEIRQVFMLFAQTNRTIVVNDPGFGKIFDISSAATQSSAAPVEVYGYPSSVAKSSGSRRRARTAMESSGAVASTTRMTSADMISKSADLMIFVPFYRSNHQFMAGATERKFKFGTRFRENQNYEQYAIVTHKFPGIYLLPTGNKYVEISPTHRTAKTYTKNPDAALYLVAYLYARK